MEKPKPTPIEATISFSLRKLQSYTPDHLRDPVTRKEFLKTLGGIGGFWATSGIMGFGFRAYLDYLLGPAYQEGISHEEAPQRYEELHPTSVQGKDIQLIGVTHTPKNFFTHETAITNHVKQAPFVVLEYFGPGIQPRALPTTSDKELQEIKVYDDNPMSFFGAIGRACAREGKDIIVVNPESQYTQFVDIYLALGLGLTLIATDAVNLLKKIAKQKHTRRGLARGIGYAAAGMIYASWLEETVKFRNTLEEKGILSSTLSEKEKADILGWNFVDYRNVRSAQGIEKAMELFGNEIHEDQRVPFFQGAWHNGVQEYVKNPTLAKVKNASYAPYHLGEDNMLRRYSLIKIRTVGN